MRPQPLLLQTVFGIGTKVRVKRSNQACRSKAIGLHFAARRHCFDYKDHFDTVEVVNVHPLPDDDVYYKVKCQVYDAKRNRLDQQRRMCCSSCIGPAWE